MTAPRTRPSIELAASCWLAAFALFWFADTIADPDLWGHLRFGRDILRAGSVVRIDTYSYRTSGQAWINHEWLSEAIFAATYDRSGPRGLIALKVVVGLAIVGLCHAHLRRRGLGPVASSAMLAYLSIPFHLGLATVRPQVFTYLLFLVELLLLDRAMRGRTRDLWWLPLVFAIWVNLHGGVLAGAGVLGLWIVVRAVGHLMDAESARIAAILPLGLLGLACGLAMLANPYGATLIAFLLRTATGPRPEISEWAPMGLTSMAGLMDLGLLALGIAGLAGSGRRREPAAIAIFAVSAMLPMVASRHYPLFAMATVVLAGEHVADVLGRLRRPAAGRGPAILLLAAAAALSVLAIPRLGCIRIEPFYFPFPARAVAMLNRAEVRGNMAVPFDWGEFVIWHLGPSVQVSIDGRRETVYSDESYEQARDLARGTRIWDALLKAPPATDLVMAPNGSPTANLMARADGWVPLYQDTRCLLFAREGLPAIDRLVRTPVPALPDDGGGLCFPDLAPSWEAPRRDGGRP